MYLNSFKKSMQETSCLNAVFILIIRCNPSQAFQVALRRSHSQAEAPSVATARFRA